MTTLPRLVDMLGPDKPKTPARPYPTSMIAEDGSHLAIGEPLPLDLSNVRRSRRHKSIATRDARPVMQGESYPIAGEPMALDERPKPSLAAVTFDGAMPPRKA